MAGPAVPGGGASAHGEASEVGQRERASAADASRSSIRARQWREPSPRRDKATITLCTRRRSFRGRCRTSTQVLHLAGDPMGLGVSVGNPRSNARNVPFPTLERGKLPSRRRRKLGVRPGVETTNTSGKKRMGYEVLTCAWWGRKCRQKYRK